jgi:hypothetical protein
MSMSNAIVTYTKADPARVYDVVASLGAESEFHASHGYFFALFSGRRPRPHPGSRVAG